MLYRLPSLFLVLTMLASCTAYTGSFAGLGARHSDSGAATYCTIAVLPIRVTEVRMRGFGKLPAPDTTTTTRLRARQRSKKLAYELQLALATQLQRKQTPANRTMWLQPVRETNSRLQQAGITYDNLPNQPLARVQQVLGTDALLLGQTMISRVPASVGFAAGILTNHLGKLSSTLASTTLVLQDPRTEQPTWQTSFSSTGQQALLPGDLSGLAAQLLQPLPPTFPYR
jgi:hypothetical protein